MFNIERGFNEPNLYNNKSEKDQERAEKRIVEIFENENCKIFSEDNENTTIETIDYEDDYRIIGFLMKNTEGEDIGYASFSSKEKDRAHIDINYLKTKHITNLQEDFPESTKKSLNNENFEMLAAIKIYSEFKEGGFGRTLMEYAMEYLSKKEFKELYVSSDVTAMMNNPIEKSFYEKIGYSTKREGADVIIDLKKWHENYLKKKEHRFASEMNKPSSEWSEEFKHFVENKKYENKLQIEQEELDEILKDIANKDRDEWTEEEEGAYLKRKEFIKLQEFHDKERKDMIEMYFDNFELEEDEIISKKIMDIGCGSEAEFVKYALEKLDAKNVYGLDVNLEKELLEEHPNNLYKGNFYERFPIDNLDLVIARAALYSKDLEKEGLLENILNSLSEEGELRVYPIFKGHPESEFKEILEKEAEFIEILNKFSEKFNFDYNLRVKDVSVYGKDEYPRSKNLLTIKKQKKIKLK